MRLFPRLLLTTFLLLIGAAQTASSQKSPTRSTPSQSKVTWPFSHVFVMVLENYSLNSVIGNPHLPALNRLAAQGGLATHYDGWGELLRF